MVVPYQSSIFSITYTKAKYNVKIHTFLAIFPLLLAGCGTIDSPTEEGTTPTTAVYESSSPDKLMLHARPPQAASGYIGKNGGGSGMRGDAPTRKIMPAIPPSSIYAPDAVASDPKTLERVQVTGLSIKKEERKPSKIAYQKSSPKPAPDEILSQIANSASMAYNVPKDPINIDETFEIQLILDLSKTVEEIAKDITVPGTVISNDIKVSKVISARLVAPTFIITTDIPEQQALAGAEPTIWKWTLKPTIEGKQTIRLAIDAIVIVDGGKAERHIKTFEQTITVDINKPQLITRWLKEYGQWLWTSMLLPLIIWLWRKYRHVPEKI